MLCLCSHTSQWEPGNASFATSSWNYPHLRNRSSQSLISFLSPAHLVLFSLAKDMNLSPFLELVLILPWIWCLWDQSKREPWTWTRLGGLCPTPSLQLFIWGRWEVWAPWPRFLHSQNKRTGLAVALTLSFWFFSCSFSHCPQLTSKGVLQFTKLSYLCSLQRLFTLLLSLDLYCNSEG